MIDRIRPERQGDAQAIRSLVEDAFRGAPYSDGNEGRIVDRLRADGDLELSLVAVDDGGAITGHIAFSPCRIETAPGRWCQLAPVSVRPDVQRLGTGSALVRAGICTMRERGFAGIALVGDPAYYSRFGFTGLHGVGLDPAMDPYLQILLLDADAPPSGRLQLAPGFG